MVDNLIQARRQLETLRSSFADKLPERVGELRNAATGLTADASPEAFLAGLEALRALAHKLAGAAGTFGFPELGEQARRLEMLCAFSGNEEEPPGEGLRALVLRAMKEIERLTGDAAKPPRKPADGQPDGSSLTLVPEARGRRILLVEDDVAVGEQLATVLPNFGFKVDWLQHPGELLQALESGPPDVLLMDIVYPDGRDLGVTTVRDLREQGKLDCPVVFLSVRDDFEARLQAARTGCEGYLSKPLDVPDLVETLKHHVRRARIQAYRVLAVEDDPDLAAWYRLQLGNAGFEVRAVTDPNQAVPALRAFRPDVILMDIEMPDCSGLELASVIRQHVEYLQIPIVFITGADHRDNRLDAWRSGGDDFILKPARPETLIPSLRARAEKSRALVALSVHQKVKASRERFHVLASVSPVATLYTDPQGLCLFVNARFGSMTGAEADAAFGRHWTRWVHPDDRPWVMDRWSQAARQGAAFEAEMRLAAEPDRAPQWVIGRASPQTGDDGEVVGYAATLTDISELKRTGVALAEAKHMLETTFSSLRDVVLVIDLKDGVMVHANAAVGSLFGYQSEDLEGRPLALLFHAGDDCSRYLQRLREDLSEYGVFSADVRMCTREGRFMLAEHTATILGHEPHGSSVVIVIRDVTEPRALAEQLVYQANHDALTGLNNRLELERRLEQFLEQARREGLNGVLCALDLDRFKLINDSCGHHAGDQVLKDIGGLLGNTVRQVDTLARLGGDEFALLMERCSLSQARRVAEAVLQAVEGYRFDWNGQRFSVGISIGLVALNRDSGGMGEVLRAADSACYAAKEGGRHRCHVFNEEDEPHLRRYDEAHWGMLIESALENERFELFFQPIEALNGAAGTGIHCELLLRMRGEAGELIGPDDFLPAAEHFHLSTRIDRWVLASALDWFAGRTACLENLHLCAINLSGQSLGDDRFLEFALRRLHASAVAPEKICFEITETAAVSDVTKARHFIRRLKEAGCRFALDDFGTGVSNFAYLKRLPVDYLKIDGSFVKDMLSDPLDQAMVNAIHQIGHVLGKETIAEYVETESIMQRLRQIGVDYVQGFQLGRARPLKELVREQISVDNGKRQ